MPGPATPRRRRYTAILAAAAGTLALLAAPPVAQAAPPGPPAPAAPRPSAINDLAPAPYLGWNTYYGLGSTFTAQTIEDEADAIVDRGLKAAGYTYVWIDGGWWNGSRDATGQITVDRAQWPDGMKAVADYIHARGLKAGIYTDAGVDGCGGTAQGSYGHYRQDANTFAAWGYDAVKVDFCGGEKLGLDPATQYGQFRDALLNNASHRPMLFNICNPFVPETGAPPGKSAYDSWTFGPTTGNSWRTDTDIGFVHNVQYPDLLRNLDDDAKHPEAAGPGHWNDPDYLAPELGLTPAEAQTQFSMWSVLAAPLIVGSDVRALSQATIEMLTNREVLAIDQDPLGRQGTALSTDGDSQVWVKPLANGDRAVALFNRGDTATTIATSAHAAGLPAAAAYSLRDVWAHTTTESAGTISAAVAPHSVVLYRVSAHADVLTTAPAVTLAPAHTTPAYPGSSLRLAVPGSPVTVTSLLRNDARIPIANVRVALTAPAGWDVRAQGATSAVIVPTGRSIRLQWRVTPAAGALPGMSELRLTARYTWVGVSGGHKPRPVLHTETPGNVTTVQVPNTPPSGSTTLAEHAWLRGTSGYLVPRIDQEVAGGPLVMHGTTYPTGVGTASPSTIEYYVGGRCTSLTATVGIDDSANFDPTGGTAVFQVYGDGTKLYDSGLVTRAATHAVSVQLGSAQVLRLVVGDGGDGGYNDRTDWAGLNLQCAAAPGLPWPQYASLAGATASSANDGYPAGNAVDGHLATLWHSQFSPVHDPLPISFTVDVGAARAVDGLTYQPRLDGDTTGTVTGYTVEVSTDGTHWSSAAPAGTWAGDATTKSVSFPSVTARYVRLNATDGVNGYASAAEIGVARTP